MKIKYIILSLIILLTPTLVKASDVDYEITNYYIDSYVLENGDLEIKELIVLNGSFNGYIRELATSNSVLSHSNKIDFEHDAIYNASGIYDMKIGAKKVDDVSFDTFNDEFETLEIGDSFSSNSKKTVVTKYSNYDEYKMYYRSNNESVAFFLDYKLDKAIVLHNDVAELYWQFIGNDFTDQINDLKIRIHLPNNDESESFKVWAHGDLTGEIEKENNKTVYAHVKYLYPNSPVDIRMTFDKNLITDTSKVKKSNEEALDSILKVEKERALEANRIRKRQQKLVAIANYTGIFLIIFQIVNIIYIYFKHDKEYKSDFNNDYYREFFDDFNVEVGDYILKRTITPNAMSASIMNLIYKKNIKAEKIEEGNKDNYEFTLLNKDNLSDTEIKLVNFLFEKIGDNNKFTTEKLKKYAKSTKTYSDFNNTYTSWKNSVISDGKKLKIFETSIPNKIFNVLFCLLVIFIGIIFSTNIGLSIPYVIATILSIIVVIYSLQVLKRTKYGNEQYLRLKASKKFLLDFGTFDIKELPEIALWERYMVYATLYGIASKVSKTMNVKIQEISDYENIQTFHTNYYNFQMCNIINSSISSAVSMANHTAMEVAASSMSSSSGSGGGFSSGGGFGGGGGGGHGF